MVLLLVTMTPPGSYRVPVPARACYDTEDERQTATARSAGASAGA